MHGFGSKFSLRLPVARSHVVIYLQEIIQDRYHEEIFSALIPTLQAPEPRYVQTIDASSSICRSYFRVIRVHSHAAAAIINFCTGVDGDTLQPYLDAIVQGLLVMLHTNSRRYVQEQAITTLAMVADAAADSFRQVCRPPVLPGQPEAKCIPYRSTIPLSCQS